jgi:hypothetical protein
MVGQFKFSAPSLSAIACRLQWLRRIELVSTNSKERRNRIKSEKIERVVTEDELSYCHEPSPLLTEGNSHAE